MEKVQESVAELAFFLYFLNPRERKREMQPGERKKKGGGGVVLERRRKLDTSHMPQLEEENFFKEREKNAS